MQLNLIDYKELTQIAWGRSQHNNDKTCVVFAEGIKYEKDCSLIWYCIQARSQDLKKGGAILKEWEVCIRRWLEFSLTLNQFQTVCPKFETKCLGNIGNSKVFSAQN